MPSTERNLQRRVKRYSRNLRAALPSRRKALTAATSQGVRTSAIIRCDETISAWKRWLMVRSQGHTSQPSVSPLVELRDLCKSFGETLAVNHISLTLPRGQIVALLGENGAGKSTLIKLLAGIYQPDHGSILLHGEPIDHRRNNQLAFIHQDHGLIDSMTIAENIALVSGYNRALGLIDWRSTRQHAERSLEHVGLRIDPTINVSDLSRTERSLVVIARALSMHVDVLVLDEPTASLPTADVDRLFDVLRHLRERGVGMIYVTHRIDEVFRIADRVAVMRDGRLVTTRNVSETSSGELVNAIVGRPLSAVFIRAPKPSSEPILELRGVQLGALKPVSFSAMAGEIVGLTGLRGAGHELLGRAIAGILPRAHGDIRIRGRRAVLGSPRQAIAAGVTFITSNREEESLAPGLTVRENLFINPSTMRRRLFSFLLPQSERRQARELLERFYVRPADPDRVIATLSGGNQQKAVLARGFATPAFVFALEEPTQGVDVGAKADIYVIMNQALSAGCCILILSSDFEEVALVCNRAFVFNRGEMVAELSREEISVPRLVEFASAATGN
jgi:ribose transport system ATP-binding protein